jgi:hypothetical protein
MSAKEMCFPWPFLSNPSPAFVITNQKFQFLDQLFTALCQWSCTHLSLELSYSPPLPLGTTTVVQVIFYDT